MQNVNQNSQQVKCSVDESRIASIAKEQDILTAALQYGQAGLAIIPCVMQEKRPRIKGWQQRASTTEKQIRGWWSTWPDSSIGLPVGERTGFFVLDVDQHDPEKDGEATLAALESQHGKLPETLTSRTGGGGRQLYFRLPEGAKIRNAVAFAPGLDIRTTGGQVILPPSKHPSGGIYRWEHIAPVADAPQWLVEAILLGQKTRKTAQSKNPETSTSKAETSTQDHKRGQLDLQEVSAYAATALEEESAAVALAPQGERNVTLNNAACSLGSLIAAGELRQEGAEAELLRAAEICGLPTEEARKTIASGLAHGMQKPRKLPEKGSKAKAPKEPTRSFQELHDAIQGVEEPRGGGLAQLTGDLLQEVASADLNASQRDVLYKTIAKVTGVSIKAIRQDAAQAEGQASEKAKQDMHLAAARQIVDEIGQEDLICVGAKHGQLWRYLGGVWQPLGDRFVKKMVHAVLDFKDVKKSATDSILDLVKNEVSREEHQWDVCRAGVNCTNGVAHWNGDKWELQNHCREDYRTSQLPLEYNPEAAAPAFEQFLQETFEHDEDRIEKIRLVKEAIGYSVSTSTHLEAAFMLYGEPATGKTTLLNAILDIVGQGNFSAVTPGQLSNRFQIGFLQGKLLNVVAELEEGESLPAPIIKGICSGDTITAEVKHKDPFTFSPHCTLWWASNHLPSTRDTSGALARRLKIITFNRARDPQEFDHGLRGRLAAEAEGILSTCLAAYGDVLKRGQLTKPKSAEAALKRWELGNDLVRLFLSEFTREGVNAREASGELYARFRAFSEAEGVKTPLSHRVFAERLQRLGYPRVKANGIRYFNGLELAGVETEDPEEVA